MSWMDNSFGLWNAGFDASGFPRQQHHMEPKKMNTAVASEGNGRVVNNTVRHSYRVLSDAEKASMVAIKDKGLELIELCKATGQSREMSLAITKAEEAVMWAVKHFTASPHHPTQSRPAVNRAAFAFASAGRLTISCEVEIF